MALGRISGVGEVSACDLEIKSRRIFIIKKDSCSGNLGKSISTICLREERDKEGKEGRRGHLQSTKPYF